MNATAAWRRGVVAIAVTALAACASTSESPQGASDGTSPAAPRAGSASDLARTIAGTTWQWSRDYGPLTFGSDGYCRLAEWDSRGLLTAWKAIDDHTVLLTIERGRDDDRYAVCVFNEDLTEYSGFNFHGTQAIDVSRRHQAK